MSKTITKKIKLGILSLSALGLLAACADEPPVVDDPATDPVMEGPEVTDPAEDDVEDAETDPVEEDAGDDTEEGT